MSCDGWAALPRGAGGCLRFVIVVFSDHTHLLLLYLIFDLALFFDMNLFLDYDFILNLSLFLDLELTLNLDFFMDLGISLDLVILNNKTLPKYYT